MRCNVLRWWDSLGFIGILRKDNTFFRNLIHVSSSIIPISAVLCIHLFVTHIQAFQEKCGKSKPAHIIFPSHNQSSFHVHIPVNVMSILLSEHLQSNISSVAPKPSFLIVMFTSMDEYLRFLTLISLLNFYLLLLPFILQILPGCSLQSEIDTSWKSFWLLYFFFFFF